jgi:hypothetical protein
MTPARSSLNRYSFHRFSFFPAPNNVAPIKQAIMHHAKVVISNCTPHG